MKLLYIVLPIGYETYNPNKRVVLSAILFDEMPEECHSNPVYRSDGNRKVSNSLGPPLLIAEGYVAGECY